MGIFMAKGNRGLIYFLCAMIYFFITAAWFVSGEYFLAIIWLIVAIVNFISGVIRRKK